MSKAFYKHLHAFRGLAILGVVCSHAVGIQVVINGGPETSSQTLILNSIQEMFFHGSTLFFALISGLLFSLVLRDRGWHSFYKSKVLNVLIPYMLVSTILTIIVWKGSVHSFVLVDANITEIIKSWVKNIIMGRAMYHLWYIPVLLFLFLLTPALSWLVFQCKQKFFLLAVILLPLISSRTWPDHSLFSLFYFIGAYTFGIWLGANYEKVMNWVAQYSRRLLVIVLITSLCIFLLKFYHIGYFSFFSPAETLWYIQKLILSCLLLFWFRKIEDHLPKILSVFAVHAFALFFLHAVFMLMFAGIQIENNLNAANLPNMLFSALIVGTLSTLCSLVISIGVKKFAGKHSRLLLGS